MSLHAAVPRSGLPGVLITLTGWKRALAAAGLGALGAQSLPPTELWPLLAVALCGLVLLTDAAAAAPSSRRQALLAHFITGWCFGFGWFAVSLAWIGEAFFVDAADHAWMMPLAISGLPAYLALWWGLALLLCGLLWQPGNPGRILILAALLTAADWMRGHALTGFPWNAPGYAAFGLPGLPQAAALMGLWGLSLLVIACAAAPVLLLDRRRPALLTAAAVIALTAGLSLWGAARLAAPLPADTDLRLRIVQPNVPQSDKWREDNARAMFDQLLAASAAPSESGADPALIIWPESAVSFLMDEAPAALSEVARLLGPGRVLATGAIRRNSDDLALPPRAQRYYNSLLLITGDGEVAARYDKWHLVPGGEFLPFERLLTGLGLRRLVSLPGSFTEGPGPLTLHLPGLPSLAPLICYEAIFPGITPVGTERPQMLVNITNDGWFGQSGGPHQHLDQARMRAIEEGLPLVRAANTGISAVVDARGSLRASLGLGLAGVLDARLPGAADPTPYARFGDAIALILLMLALAAGLTLGQLCNPRLQQENYSA